MKIPRLFAILLVALISATSAASSPNLEEAELAFR
jgi:hypothetical protein